MFHTLTISAKYMFEFVSLYLKSIKAQFKNDSTKEKFCKK